MAGSVGLTLSDAAELIAQRCACSDFGLGTFGPGTFLSGKSRRSLLLVRNLLLRMIARRLRSDCDLGSERIERRTECRVGGSESRSPLGVRAAVAARTVEREADGACRPVPRDVEPANATRVVRPCCRHESG